MRVGSRGPRLRRPRPADHSSDGLRRRRKPSLRRYWRTPAAACPGRRVQPPSSACRHRRWTRRSEPCRSISIASRPTCGSPPPSRKSRLLFTNVGNCRRSRPLSCVYPSVFKGLRLACALHYHRESGETRRAVMWKIERVEHEGVVIFALSGRIEGEQVAELQRLVAAEAAEQRIVLDLQEVQLVDHDTVRFLVGCAADGTQLEHCPAYIRKWMARVRGAQ